MNQIVSFGKADGNGFGFGSGLQGMSFPSEHSAGSPPDRTKILDTHQPVEAETLQILIQQKITLRIAVQMGDAAPAQKTTPYADNPFLPDMSPEATAERIYRFAAAFYPSYAQRTDGSESEKRDRFTSIVGKAIQKGFDEARTILTGMGVYQGKIQENAEKTIQLALAKLESFRSQGEESPR